MERQIPRWQELRPLLQFKQPVLTREQRIANALTIDDLRKLAKRRAPTAPFDYADGGADDEITLARNVEAFRQVEFHPHALVDVSKVDLGIEVLGRPSALPFGISPTGFTRMMHAAGELAGVSAAADAGIPFGLSTLGTTSIEQLAAAAPTARRWFQLYLWKDHERSRVLMQRAAAAGFEALMMTVDTPGSGVRLRDARNGMTVPPTLSVRTLIDALPHIGWWFDFLTTEPLTFASVDSMDGTMQELLAMMFDPSLTFDDLTWVRENWHGKLVVKGIQTLPDAVRAVDAGADAVLLSNHGGRQIDRGVVPFHLLPDVVRELGDQAEVFVDSGIRHGSDIVAALALGADFTMVGRAYLYGLMAGGRPGVDRTIAILAGQAERTMRLLGATSVSELEPGHVTQLRRLTPSLQD